MIFFFHLFDFFSVLDFVRTYFMILVSSLSVLAPTVTFYVQKKQPTCRKTNRNTKRMVPPTDPMAPHEVDLTRDTEVRLSSLLPDMCYPLRTRTSH